MKHRIRAAGILIAENKILLALEEVTEQGTEVWIPPGGGLEEQDGSAAAALEREFHEETGLRISVQDLAYVREFRDQSAGVHHLELFFLVSAVGGEIHAIDRADATFGVTLHRHVAWFTQEELRAIVVAPRELCDDVWDRIAGGWEGARYLGSSTPVGISEP